MERETTIKDCQFIKTLYQNEGFSIALYKTKEVVASPDGKPNRVFCVKGYNLPTYASLRYEFTGNFEKYKDRWTFAASDIKEVEPTNADSAKAYLLTIKGIGKKNADKLLKAFGTEVFNVMEKEPEKMYNLKGFSKKQVDKILADYSRRSSARKLFQFLYKYKVRESKIMYIKKELGADALSIIKEDPFVLFEIGSVSFGTADAIAKNLQFPPTFRSRQKAAILEVLKQAEHGGELFSSRTAFPRFIYEAFLPQQLLDLAQNESELYRQAGTYLPEGICYLMLLKLLCYPITFAQFRDLVHELLEDEQIYAGIYGGEVVYYRWYTAKAEFQAAKKISDLLYLARQMTDLAREQQTKKINDALSKVEGKLQMKLADEQKEAVKMALLSKISVITGGPGTGKTSVEKGIIQVYKQMHPRDGILLIAPTGRAAKRMSESTGQPASTIHKALSLIPSDDDGAAYCSNTTPLPETLIIVDEASMIGSFLLNSLLQRVSMKSKIVFIGDVDQLPSIEIGSILKEMIASEVPVTKLTKTFRQASGSNIITNAAKINSGEKQMDYGEDFSFLEVPANSAQNAIVDVFLDLHNAYSDDDIVVLSPYRKRTETGTDALNIRLRSEMRPEIANGQIPSFIANGTTFYEGDKVMYIRNSEELTNGDVGKITSVMSTSDGRVIKCNFDGNEVELSDDDLLYLDLAYALTVHKSQGAEYKAVIVVCDNRHKILLKRNLVYTAITRAKEKVVLIGSQSALEYAIDCIDSNNRRTLLAYISDYYLEKREARCKPKKKEEK